MLWVERTLTFELLPQLQRDADSELLAGPLAAHLGETRMQAARVEDVFVAAGAEPAAAASAALQGLQQEYGALVGSIVEPRLRDLFLVSAAAKTEHLEIALYAGVIPLARRVTGEAGDLEQSLAEEQQALVALEQAAEALLARTPA